MHVLFLVLPKRYFSNKKKLLVLVFYLNVPSFEYTTLTDLL
jgi:hypothetical protein